MIQIILEPLFVFILLFIDGIFLGLFWPNLISSVSAVSNYENIRDNDSMKDNLIKHYTLSSNIGGIGSYLIGSFILFIISDILIVFRVILIYIIIGLIIVLLFEEPNMDVVNEGNIIREMSLNVGNQREHIKFPIYIPLFLIVIHSFLVGSLGLVYPLKSEFLGFPLYTTYLFNSIRMASHTLMIYLASSLSVKVIKKIIPIIAVILSFCVFLMGICSDLILFGILFGIFGSSIAFLYVLSFRLIVFRNIAKNTSKYSVYFETVVGISFFTAPIITGYIVILGINLGFYFMSIIALVGLTIFLVIKQKLIT